METTVFQVGDWVRLVRIPPEALEPPEVPEDITTREIFEHCLGRVFRVDNIFEDLDLGTQYVLGVGSEIRQKFGNVVDELYVNAKDIEAVRLE